mmetsp:Transcript_59380/g.109822  ORF Transcript_59380/g.109822 Transcript_59380/m.109822 type:complete len:199 (+) Transcript_59380:788-1384(+)
MGEKKRLFVLAVNASEELALVHDLYEALARIFPHAEALYLLVLVDLQSWNGPVFTEELGRNVMFYRMPAALWNHTWQDPWTLQRQSEGYATAIAFAIHTWANHAYGRIRQLSSLQDLLHTCDPFYAGSTSGGQFQPRKAPAGAVPVVIRRSRSRSLTRGMDTRRSFDAGAESAMLGEIRDTLSATLDPLLQSWRSVMG